MHAFLLIPANCHCAAALRGQQRRRDQHDEPGSYFRPLWTHVASPRALLGHSAVLLLLPRTAEKCILMLGFYEIPSRHGRSITYA